MQNGTYHKAVGIYRDILTLAAKKASISHHLQ